MATVIVFSCLVLVSSTFPVLAEEVTFTIGSSSPHVISKSLNKGQKLKVEFQASGVIDLLIMDSDNYQNYLDGKASVNEAFLNDYTTRSYTLTAPETDTYFFVFQTRGSNISVTVNFTAGGTSISLGEAQTLNILLIAGLAYILFMWLIGSFVFGVTFSYSYRVETEYVIRWGWINVPQNNKAPLARFQKHFLVFLITNVFLYVLFAIYVFIVTR